MKVDDLPAPGGLVQTVDILGEEQLAPAVGFEPRQRVMRVVGLGFPNRRQPTMLRAQYRWRVFSSATNAWNRTGCVRFQSPLPSR